MRVYAAMGPERGVMRELVIINANFNNGYDSSIVMKFSDITYLNFIPLYIVHIEYAYQIGIKNAKVVRIGMWR